MGSKRVGQYAIGGFTHACDPLGGYQTPYHAYTILMIFPDGIGSDALLSTKRVDNDNR